MCVCVCARMHEGNNLAVNEMGKMAATFLKTKQNNKTTE